MRVARNETSFDAWVLLLARGQRLASVVSRCIQLVRGSHSGGCRGLLSFVRCLRLSAPVRFFLLYKDSYRDAGSGDSEAGFGGLASGSADWRKGILERIEHLSIWCCSGVATSGVAAVLQHHRALEHLVLQRCCGIRCFSNKVESSSDVAYFNSYKLRPSCVRSYKLAKLRPGYGYIQSRIALPSTSSSTPQGHSVFRVFRVASSVNMSS